MITIKSENPSDGAIWFKLVIIAIFKSNYYVYYNCHTSRDHEMFLTRRYTLVTFLGFILSLTIDTFTC